MSLRSRARRLQHATSLSYQRALETLRALADGPALLAKRAGWSLSRADAFCVDKGLDEEWRTVSARSTRVDERTCGGCEALFFAGDSERVEAERRCPACRSTQIVRAQTIVERLPVETPDPVRLRLEQVVERANAVAAVFISRLGVVYAGELTEQRLVFLRMLRAPTDPDLPESAARLRLRTAQLVAEGFADLVGGEAKFHVQSVATFGQLIVIYDERSSLGLVRLASVGAAASLAALFNEPSPFGPLVPPTSGTPPSGAPAQVAAGLARFGWTPPKTSDPN